MVASVIKSKISVLIAGDTWLIRFPINKATIEMCDNAMGLWNHNMNKILHLIRARIELPKSARLHTRKPYPWPSSMKVSIEFHGTVGR